MADVLESNSSDINPDQHLIDDLGASSLDIAEMIWRIEDDPFFGVGEIPDDVLDQIGTIGHIIAFIEHNQQASIKTPEPGQASMILGADHHGRLLREVLVQTMESLGHLTEEIGAVDDRPVDLVEVAQSAATAVARNQASRAILIGLDGMGMAMVANKVPGVRAISASTGLQARMARERHNANVLCLGAGIIGTHAARECLTAFLETPFEPGPDDRRTQRVHRILEIEKRHLT
ncbi:MAG: RpiB/LacA/LacB family sugar-phosphate isomerase [Actinomycetia bacterium]|nr:RpiB/LacA/LacB family sugar-phosphate isomerase [Actinomycetes bacterium]